LSLGRSTHWTFSGREATRTQEKTAALAITGASTRAAGTTTAIDDMTTTRCATGAATGSATRDGCSRLSGSTVRNYICSFGVRTVQVVETTGCGTDSYRWGLATRQSCTAPDGRRGHTHKITKAVPAAANGPDSVADVPDSVADVPVVAVKASEVSNTAMVALTVIFHYFLSQSC